jgi:hypothetical protein
MSKRFLVFILFIGLAASVFFLPGGGAKEAAGLPNFTIPTRTPTGQPTSPSAPTNTRPPTNTPAPTAQPTNPAQPTDSPPPPGDTATPLPVPPAETGSPTVAPNTPISGSWPTAVACGVPPTIQTQGASRVRSGPGTDYTVVANLLALEVRPIVGRAANSPWWLIELAPNQTGWIADSVVAVQGYIGSLPIVAPPPINGQAPTPGALWQPTAVPNCPTATATPPGGTTSSGTATPAADSTATAVRPVSTVINLPIGATATIAPDTFLAADNAERSNAVTSVVPTTGASITAARTDTEAPPTATAAPLSGPGRAANNGSAAASAPCATALIGVAAVFFVGRRKGAVDSC